MRSSTLAEYSQALAPTDPGLAAQLAVAAYRTAPTQDATTALNIALQSPLLDNILIKAGSAVDRTAVQADGPLGAAVDSSGTVRVWNLGGPGAPGAAGGPGGPVLAATLRTAGLTGIALAPHAPLLAAACSTPGLCLWSLADPARPALEARLPTPVPGLGHTTSMAVSPDGTLLAAASESGYSLLWSIAEPTRPRLLADLPDPSSTPGLIASVDFAPTGGLLAESIEGGATSLYSLSGPADPTLLATIAAGYQDVTINPAGTELAGANDTSLDLWNIGRPTAPTPITYGSGGTYPSTNEDFEDAAFSPDGGTLAYGGSDVDDGNAGLCLLDLTDISQNTNPICMSTGFSTLGMTYTGSGALLTGGLDGAVRLWRPSPAVLTNANSYDFLEPLAVSGDGRLMAGALTPTSLGATSAAGIWNLDAPAGPTLVAALPQSSAGTGATPVSTDVVANIAQDGEVQLWNIADPRHPRLTGSLGTVSASTFGLYNVTFNAARSTVAVLSNGGVLNLWHVSPAGAATLIGSLTDPAAAQYPGGVLSEGDTAYMTTSTRIDWWDIADPAHPVETGSLPLSTGYGSAIEGNSTTLFTTISTAAPDGGGATLKLYSLEDGRVRSAATVSRHSGNQIALSADGHFLAASAPEGNELTIWSTANVRAPKVASTIVTAYDITGVAFSADDDLMADWSLQTIQLWNTSNPDIPVLVGEFAPVYDDLGSNVSETVNSVSFIPGGRMLVTANSEGPSLTYLFATDPDLAVDQVCSITTNPITPTQWAQYAPGTPYQDPC